jgi:homotetrameric NADPH-dependent glutamate synthase
MDPQRNGTATVPSAPEVGAPGYRIVSRERFGPRTFLLKVRAPDVARACQPGQFVMVRIDETGERIPLTISDFDRDEGTLTLVVQAVGKTTFEMMELAEGQSLLDVVGPLGAASLVEQRSKVVLVGGGLGVGPIFPLLRRHAELGSSSISVLGFRSKDRMFWTDRFQDLSGEVRVATDDGSFGTEGTVADVLTQVLAEHDDVDEVVAIGPLAMMQACAEITRPRGIRTTVSLNSIMVDGTGMCGSCRVTVDGRMRFACVDGPDFDGHRVDFDELALRMGRFRYEERECLSRYEDERQKLRSLGPGGSNPAELPSRMRSFALSHQPVPTPDPVVPGPVKTRNVNTVSPRSHPMPVLDPEARVECFDEVGLGYDLATAVAEADRCIQCKRPKCVEGCPVRIDIPGFIGALARKDMQGSYRILKASNTLPAVCGRVCPQEIQCEASCVVGKKRDPVAVGRLERFVADFAAGRGWDEPGPAVATGRRVAIIGSGPAGLACAGDLARAGVEVTVFEALHVAGGVMKYGIPEFRLPNDTIDVEIADLAARGVKFELDAIIGQLFTIRQLLDDMGFDAVFIGTGAGSPKFMGIPGESLNGVVSANEFLTRVNLMQGFRQPLYDTPVGMGKRVAVVGAGNTAIDACRVALRMGADDVFLVYRRTERESPARAEELRHAVEEGVHPLWLTNPTRVRGNEDGWVTGLEVVGMELGEPDETGRPRPRPKTGTERVLPVDMVIEALGTSANPTIARMVEGLTTNERGYIEVDPDTQMTSVPGVFAGGDIVTGSATVILAMGAGRRAAAGILDHLGVTLDVGDPRLQRVQESALSASG